MENIPSWCASFAYIFIFIAIIIKLKQYTNEFDANQTIIQLQNYFCRNCEQCSTKEEDDETNSKIWQRMKNKKKIILLQ